MQQRLQALHTRDDELHGQERGNSAVQPAAQQPRGYAPAGGDWYNTENKGRPTLVEVELAAYLMAKTCARKHVLELLLVVEAERETWSAKGDAWAPKYEGAFGKGGCVEAALKQVYFAAEHTLQEAAHMLNDIFCIQLDHRQLRSYLRRLSGYEVARGSKLEGPKRDAKGSSSARLRSALPEICGILRQKRSFFQETHHAPRSPLSTNMELRDELHAKSSELAEVHAQLARAQNTARRASSRVASSRTRAAKERVKARRAQLREEQRRAMREQCMSKAEAAWECKLESQRQRANACNRRARAAEAARARAKTVAGKRLQRSDADKAALLVANQKIEELMEELDELRSTESARALAVQRMQAMPTWACVRGEGAGRGKPMLDWTHRVAIYQQLATGTPASAIGRNIVSVVKLTAPWLEPIEPTVATIRGCRFELRICEEALAARRVAGAYSVRQLGFDETTKFQDPSMVTSVLIEPKQAARREVVILRAAYSTGGGTAENLVAAMETKCFARLRRYLRGWQAETLKLFPSHVWTGPDPERCGMQRLGGGGAVISDTCTPARKTQRLIVDEVARQVKSKMDPEVWAAMSAAEQEHSVKMHMVHCWNHIRNIFLKAMSTAQAAHVKSALSAELETFAGYERMSTDFDQMLRADYKEFHHGGRYYKGKGKEYAEFLRDKHSSAFVMLLERAEGGRQDLDYDAAVAMFINVTYMVEFLHARVFCPGHSNLLEDFIYITHCKIEFVAMMRANAAIDLLIAKPMRWLAGKSAELVDWSPYSMGKVFDMIEELFMRAKDDGSVLLDRVNTWEAFWKPITDTQPAFAEYFEHLYHKEVVLAPDGKTKHKVRLNFIIPNPPSLVPHHPLHTPPGV